MGIVLANLFPAIKKILNDGMNASIVVVGFALGCTMNFQQIFTGGLSGILLGFVVTFVGSICAILADKLTGGSGGRWCRNFQLCRCKYGYPGCVSGS